MPLCYAAGPPPGGPTRHDSRRADLRVSACAPVGRIVRAVFLAALAALAATLAACGGGGSRSAVTGPVGTTARVTLSSSTNSAQVQQGGTLVLTATVTHETKTQGVTWTIPGDPAGA